VKIFAKEYSARVKVIITYYENMGLSCTLLKTKDNFAKIRGEYVLLHHIHAHDFLKIRTYPNIKRKPFLIYEFASYRLPII
jgi:hypothetical protein